MARPAAWNSRNPCLAWTLRLMARWSCSRILFGTARGDAGTGSDVSSGRVWYHDGLRLGLCRTQLLTLREWSLDLGGSGQPEREEMPDGPIMVNPALEKLMRAKAFQHNKVTDRISQRGAQEDVGRK